MPAPRSVTPRPFRRSSPIRRCAAALPLALAFLGACHASSRVPLASADEARVDTALTGLWMPVDDADASPLLILAFNDREYLIEELPPASESAVDSPDAAAASDTPEAASPADALAGELLRSRRRAYATQVGGASFWNLQDLLDGPGERPYHFVRYERTAEGDLHVREVVRLPADGEMASSDALRRWMEANAAADSIYASPGVVYRRASPELELDVEVDGELGEAG